MAVDKVRQETYFDDAAFRGVNLFTRADVSPITDFNFEWPRNYKERNDVVVNATVEKRREGATRSVLSSPKEIPTPQQADLPLDRVRGVVDHVGDPHSQVTLLYAGRENQFLFPTSELESVGAAYAGAVFEFLLTTEANFTAHSIVHLTV